MKTFLASDHAGFEMKEEIKKYLSSLGYEFEDCGPDMYDEKDDYSNLISNGIKKCIDYGIENASAIILGGSGQGEAIVANRFKNIRCGVYYGGNLDIVKLMREHNDANALSLGARMINLSEAKAAVDIFLKTPFSREERHLRRIQEIETLTD
jgi:ribose 5-phosphate isomerase B